jgi:hypothetical protein
MGDEVQRPYGRRQFNQALMLNAASDKLNLALLVGVAAAGAVLNVFWLVLPVAIVVYLAGVARTYFDQDVADRVLGKARADRQKQIRRSRASIDLTNLAAPIADLMRRALVGEQRIREAIDRAELPYTEVSTEVDGFIDAMQLTASRAELLYEALAETPPEQIERRLRQVQNDPARKELAEALSHQLDVQHRMHDQLQRFYDQMERLVVELDTVRGNLLSASASMEASRQNELAASVRGLREQMGALAAGMSDAYEET